MCTASGNSPAGHILVVFRQPKSDYLVRQLWAWLDFYGRCNMSAALGRYICWNLFIQCQLYLCQKTGSCTRGGSTGLKRDGDNEKASSPPCHSQFKIKSKTIRPFFRPFEDAVTFGNVHWNNFYWHLSVFHFCISRSCFIALCQLTPQALLGCIQKGQVPSLTTTLKSPDGWNKFSLCLPVFSMTHWKAELPKQPGLHPFIHLFYGLSFGVGPNLANIVLKAPWTMSTAYPRAGI